MIQLRSELPSVIDELKSGLAKDIERYLAHESWEERNMILVGGIQWHLDRIRRAAEDPRLTYPQLTHEPWYRENDPTFQGVRFRDLPPVLRVL